MAANSMHPITFGVVGAIDLYDDDASLHDGIYNLASSFVTLPETVSTLWHGDRIAAITFQHSEDAQIPPGQYKYSIPQVGAYQGIVQGHFFSGFETLADDEQRLRGISHAVVSGYVDRGLRAFATLNGAWLAVVFDREKQCAVFARDGVGFETLYVATSGPRIVFASDLRAFRLAGLATEYDEQAIMEFLHYLYVPSPRSVYKDVSSVLPGHALVIDPQGTRQKRFAPPRFVQGVPLRDEGKIHAAIQDYLPLFEERMLVAAESCIPRRGRIGLLLSAGKDSTSLAVALKEVAPDRVVALTMAFGGPPLDESSDAASVCEYLGIPHKVYTPASDALIPGFQRLVMCEDQPMGDTASLPLLLASSAFPEDVSVVWDGTGNDYYFGYVHHFDEYRDHKRRQFKRFVPDFAWPLFLRIMQLGPARFASTARDWQTPLEEAFVTLNGWTQEELKRLWQRDVDWSNTYMWELVRKNTDKDWIALKSEIEGSIWTPSASIRKSVYVARAAGLALRMPLIDNRLAEFVNGLPQELQYWGYSNKTLLRAYLAKHLPRELVEKPKRYFFFDTNALIDNRNGRLLGWLEESGLLRVFPSWSKAYLAEMLSEYRKRPDVYGDRIYALSLLSLWMATSRGYERLDDLCVF
ncbi:MAG: hypothetical protein JXA33_16775 [Anaerolineae bacterium]|nr:hypothetical protein [Anaerolineae bacterium]